MTPAALHQRVLRRTLTGCLAVLAAGTLAAGLPAHLSAAAHDRPPAQRTATASGGTWGSAEEVPGTATLNAGGDATIYSLSCASAGNCAAAGRYTDLAGHDQAFVVDEKNGTWGTAQEVPGTAAVNQGGSAEASSVSCASAGNCAAGGSYKDSAGHSHAFIASEINGTWNTMQDVLGTETLDQGSNAWVSAVSCASVGNCSIGGGYDNSSGQQVFVAGETNGTWGGALEIPRTASLNAGGRATMYALSCGSAGNCGAGGQYASATNALQAFVVDETNGTWSTAREVPGTARLNVGGSAWINSLSCHSPGNCGAGGAYTGSTGKDVHAFIVGEKQGSWGAAQEAPGTASLDKGRYATTVSVSCPSAGSCGVVGNYTDSGRLTQPWLASEKERTWGTAQKVPGIATLETAGYAGMSAVSCTSIGNCSAVGVYETTKAYEPFAVNETDGTWGNAEEIPGIAALNAGGWGTINVVSCASAGNCGAGGSYGDSAHHNQAFIVSQTNGS